MRAIYHALLPRAPHYEPQWVQSVRSIRQHNRDIPLFLFHYGPPSQAVLAEVARQNVILKQSSYEALLADMPPHIARVLAQYPVVHKFAGLRDIDAAAVLYLDCDTFCYKDPEILFDRYSEAEFAAHVEPRTWRDWGPDEVKPPTGGWQLDEYMRRLTDAQGWPPFPPYNLGVCLFNHGSGKRVGALLNEFFHNLYRFMCDIIRRAPYTHWAQGAIGDDLLPYPPPSMIDPWIAEQVSAWYTWAQLGLSHVILPRQDVAESIPEIAWQPEAILAHYFNQAEHAFFTQFAARLS